tara:strand:- start:3490 stop:4080 length:591 start_codon:yes stop_codon:yes gene_type:complete
MSYFYDVMASFLIFVVFGIIFLGLVMAAMAKNIEKNWPKYKCNPIVIPMAGFLGKDAIKNFTECVGEIQGGFMDLFLGPIKYSMTMMVDLGSMLTESVNSLRIMFSSLVDGILGMFSAIIGLFLNVSIQFQQILINLRDLVMKLLGTIFTIGMVMDGFGKTAQNINSGPIGNIVRFFATFSGTLLSTDKGGAKAGR